MLDIGFRDDIRNILGQIKTPHQTIFVSATIDQEIKRLAMRYMTNPVDVDVSRDQLTVEEVDQSYVTVDRPDKFRLLRLIMEQEDPPITIVFCNTRAGARKIATRFYDSGIDAKEIHGDLVQRKRDRVMMSFRKHQIKVLVATDLAARGIDVRAISHIINYDIPQDAQIYVHRIGRTARMGAGGVAITFVTRDEGKELTNIERLINREIRQRTVPGFVPRTPREKPADPVRPTVGPRLLEPVSSAGDSVSAKRPPKTLGGRFRPSRGRRRI